MTKYAILAYPGHNRVFFAESAKLAAAEAELALRKLSPGFSELKTELIGSVLYYTFATPDKLGQHEIDRLYSLSLCYALFEFDGKSLFPLENRGEEFFDSSLGTILKYSGKTNELFTKMMINQALYSSKFFGETVTLLDPMCGKGTTLFEGLRLGYNACGIELDSKAVHEAAVFFKKYLENEKFKHQHSSQRLSGPNKSFTSNIDGFTFARDKESYKTDDKRRELVLVSGDTRNAANFFKANTFHIIVADLPYGIAHGNVTESVRKAGVTRNPSALMSECLPVWQKLLKPGGAIAMSWNTFVLKREELKALAESYGFRVMSGHPYDDLVHRVDQAIKRDVIIAVK